MSPLVWSFFFFWYGLFFKVFIEFITVLLLFYILVFCPRGMWDLSSCSLDRTHSYTGRGNLNYWTTKEVLGPIFKQREEWNYFGRITLCLVGVVNQCSLLSNTRLWKLFLVHGWYKIDAEPHSDHRPQFSGLSFGVFQNNGNELFSASISDCINRMNMNVSDRNQYFSNRVGKGYREGNMRN